MGGINDNLPKSSEKTIAVIILLKEALNICIYLVAKRRIEKIKSFNIQPTRSNSGTRLLEVWNTSLREGWCACVYITRRLKERGRLYV